MSEFKIGYAESEYIRVSVLSRQYPGNADYDDGNWVNAEVELAVGGFKGIVKGYLFADDFPQFRDGLQSLYDTLKGSAEYSTIEEWLYIKVTGDGKGRLLLKAEILDEPGIGNRLNFTMDIDQTYLPGIISGLDDISKEFPVVGKE